MNKDQVQKIIDIIDKLLLLDDEQIHEFVQNISQTTNTTKFTILFNTICFNISVNPFYIKIDNHLVEIDEMESLYNKMISIVDRVNNHKLSILEYAITNASSKSTGKLLNKQEETVDVSHICKEIIIDPRSNIKIVEPEYKVFKTKFISSRNRYK